MLVDGKSTHPHTQTNILGLKDCVKLRTDHKLYTRTGNFKKKIKRSASAASDSKHTLQVLMLNISVQS